MITETERNNNQVQFLSLVNSIEREGINKALLTRQLLESDFFYAPASGNYHNSYVGGLCEHSLNVYFNLVELCKKFLPDCDENTIKIVALFHDFSKMNYYTKEIKNKKVYSDKGSKSDSMGKYDWVSYESFTKRDVKDRFMIGNHEENSAFMTNTFIPLTDEEYCAIIHHHGSVGYDSTKQNPAEFWTKYPLSLLLYQADCIAAFIQEKNE